MAKFASSGPTPEIQPNLTDTYFKHTRNVVAKWRLRSDICGVHAPSRNLAGSLAIEWIIAMAKARGAELQIEQLYPEGAGLGRASRCATSRVHYLFSWIWKQFFATPWSSLCCCLQCLQYVYRVTESGLSRNGRAPLCRK